MNITDRIIRHMSNPERRYLVRHANANGTWTLESLDGKWKGAASAVHVTPASYDILTEDGWVPMAEREKCGAWVVGHNVHLQARDTDSEHGAYTTWADAIAALKLHALDYASTDDETAREHLNATAQPEDYPDHAENGYGDDEPGMEGDVRSALANIDTSGGLENKRVWFTADNGAGYRVEFWAEFQPDATPEQD